MRAQEFAVEADIIPLPKDRKPKQRQPGDSTGDVRRFKGQSLPWQKLEPSVLRTAYEWYWATVKKDSLFAKDDPRGISHDAISNVLILESRLREMGYQIQINPQGNIELVDKFNTGVTILPTQDAMLGRGWAANL